MTGLPQVSQKKKQRHLWLGYHRYHSKKFSPFSHICAFETVVDKFFTSINLYPSLSSVLKVYSSSKLSERSSSSAYFIFFLEEPTVSLESKSESWFSSREVVGVEEATSSTTGAVSSGSSSYFRHPEKIIFLFFPYIHTYIHKLYLSSDFSVAYKLVSPILIINFKSYSKNKAKKRKKIHNIII